MPLHALTRIRLALVFAALGVSAVLSAQSTSEPFEKGSAPLCTPDEHTLCLGQGRFAVTATFQVTPLGVSEDAHAVPVTDQTGNFWFFDPNNIELIVKILNGCTGFDSYWFFAAGLTNVGVSISVLDERSGMQKTYQSPLGTPFMPIQDTSSFRTCP